MHSTYEDVATARAFATSWNNLPLGSVYTYEDFQEWLAPLKDEDVRGKSVLELGCGNGSLLAHLARWNPSEIVGVDLGDSVRSARANLKQSGFKDFKITQTDLVSYRGDGADVVYSVGVLHHLKNARGGFSSVIANVKPGGKFHCWVYGKEGNALVIRLVEPLRRIFSRLPWWLTKYFAATPLAIPFFLYAVSIKALARRGVRLGRMPLFEYCLWIGKRPFSFFRHVAFDQLVTPQTTYISRETVEDWLASDPRIERGTTYVIMRNGNSWKFGGQVKA